MAVTVKVAAICFIGFELHTILDAAIGLIYVVYVFKHLIHFQFIE